MGDRLIDRLKATSISAFEKSDVGRLVRNKWNSMRETVIEDMSTAANMGAFSYQFDVSLQGDGARSKVEGFAEAMKCDKDFEGFLITYWNYTGGFTICVRWDK
jgi:hypothetical protein